MAVEQSGDNLPKGGCNREVNWDKGGVKPWMDTLDTVGSAGTEGIGGFFPSELLVLVPVHCNWKKKQQRKGKRQSANLILHVVGAQRGRGKCPGPTPPQAPTGTGMLGGSG